VDPERLEEHQQRGAPCPHTSSKDATATGAEAEAPEADLIDYTRQTWEPLMGQEISREEARQIVSNFVGLIKVLDEIDREQREAEDPAIKNGENPVQDSNRDGDGGEVYPPRLTDAAK
jgi:hypothetical protein